MQQIGRGRQSPVTFWHEVNIGECISNTSGAELPSNELTYLKIIYYVLCYIGDRGVFRWTGLQTLQNIQWWICITGIIPIIITLFKNTFFSIDFSATHSAKFVRLPKYLQNCVKLCVWVFNQGTCDFTLQLLWVNVLHKLSFHDWRVQRF